MSTNWPWPGVIGGKYPVYVDKYGYMYSTEADRASGKNYWGKMGNDGSVWYFNTKIGELQNSGMSWDIQNGKWILKSSKGVVETYPYSASSTTPTPADNVYTYAGTPYYLNPSDNQFYSDANFTNGTGYYLIGGKICSDSRGTPVEGAAINGHDITYTEPKNPTNPNPTPTPTASQLAWQPNNAYETMAFDWRGSTCNWSLLKNNTVINNATGKQIGTWDSTYGLDVAMPDGKSHHIDWKSNGQIDVIHDDLGPFTPSVTDLSGIRGYVLDKDGKKTLTVGNDGSIKDPDGKLVGKYTTGDDGRWNVTSPDGATSYGIYDPDAETWYPKGVTPPEKPSSGSGGGGLLRPEGKDTDILGTVTAYGSDAGKKNFSLTSGGMILDEKGKPVGTYSSPTLGEFDLKTPDNKLFGHYNANTGVLTSTDGETTINAGFTPGPAINFMPHAPAPKGLLTPVPEYKPGALTQTPEYKPGLLTPTPEYKPLSVDFKGYTPPSPPLLTPWQPNQELMTGREANNG